MSERMRGGTRAVSDAVAVAAGRRPWSLRRRLITGLVVLVALLCLAIGTVSTLALRETMIDRLESKVSELLHGPSTSDRAQAPGAPSGLPSDAGPQQHLGMVVVVANIDATGAVSIERAVSTDDTGSDTALDAEQVSALLAATEGVSDCVTVDVDGVGQFVVQRIERGGATVVSGLSMREVTAATTSLAWIFAGVGLVAVLLAAALGSLLISRALRPLDRVARTARGVASRRLAEGEVELPERVPARDTDPRTEVGQVGESLNLLLGHVEEALSARQRSETRLRRFVADASHELRTPLASIRGYTELTRREPERLSEAQAHSLERIEAESRRMGSLVEDLLLLARLDAGAAEPRNEPVDLVHLAVDALGDAAAAGRDHEWRLDLPGDEGEGGDADGLGDEADAEPAGVVVAGDPDRLHQLVTNLLANARTHTPAGTTVTVGVHRDGAEAVLRVADTGPGIDPALLPEVFGRFVRGDEARSREGGSTGLGLSIAQAIAQSHGGSIAVDSEPGRTVFEVRLPAAADMPA